MIKNLSCLLFFLMALTSISSCKEVCNVSTSTSYYYRYMEEMVPYINEETFQVIELSNSTGAKCIDGTNYKYWFQKGEGIGLDKFMIFFPGAAFCGTDGDPFYSSAYNRKDTEFGSSSTYGTNGSTISVNQAYGYFSSNKTHNPKFWNWNKIIAKYCDGSLMQGHLDDPIEYNGSLLWFRGYDNFKGLINNAKENLGLFEAKEVILLGDSSGVTSAMIYLNYLQGVLPENVKLSGFFDAGFYLNIFNQDAGCHLYEYFLRNLANYTNSSALSNELFKSCKYSNNSDEIWRCLAPQYIYKSINNPSFIANAINDCMASSTLYGIYCVSIGVDTCTSTDKIMIEELREEVYRILLEVKKNKPKWGFWLRSCFEHMYYNTWAWYGDKMNVFSAENFTSSNLRDVYYEWYDNLEKNSSFPSYIDLLGPFKNPSCPLTKETTS